ncbi:hypothetical protein TUM4433_04510 [Shewanella schlegeliana]|uniref:hypothetical protein n=1 Tax=Shewanella schlegeliana TaxID=190308 RepID=UPI001BB9F740|nr:hypothetical protein [Shewanella schlegeliana]GIU22876.1 hypothetical protein TUM4433_04510 [Shewanella schlegeliana]
MTVNRIVMGNYSASGGPDVPMRPAMGVPVASLRQDDRGYFGYHHTPNGTLAAALKQNVAAYAQLAYLMPQPQIELGSIAPKH